MASRAVPNRAVARKAPVEVAPEAPAGPGKGRATPSRREQQQARRRPLVPTDRKAASRTARSDAATERNRARIGLANGEDRYLPTKDRGPQRRFVRDVIDSRLRLGELLYPVFGVFFVGSFLITGAAQSYLFIGLWTFVVIVVADGLLAARSIRRRLVQKFGGAAVLKGLNFYVVTRVIQFRSLRMPKPQVKRGTPIR